MNRTIRILLMGAVCLTAFQQAAIGEPAKSAVLLIGDGLGVAHVTAARIFQGNARDGSLALDRFKQVALVRTYSEDMMVTDSAAAATALATGRKTRYGFAGVDSDGNDLETILERAKMAGKSVGIVTTARVTHATPAAFYANVRDRDDEQTIADQLVAYNQIDVILGGGREVFFLPNNVKDEESRRNGSREDGRDLIAEAKAAGYQVVQRTSEFEALSNDGTDSIPAKVLGLFNFSKMAYGYQRERDRWGEPSLAEMTEFALEVLGRNPNGFFLMVEGALIDHSSHENWGRVVLEEVLGFDDAVGAALTYMQSHPDTLVLATADHETGGLSINGYAGIDVGGVDLLSTEPMGGPSEILSFATGPGAKRREGAAPSDAVFYRQPALHEMGSASHTAVDVLAWAAGPGSDRIGGTMDNHELGQALQDSLFESKDD